MAIEKISLADIEELKMDEEFKELDSSTWPGAEENLSGDWEVRSIKRQEADGSEHEYLFVPDADQEEFMKGKRTEAALDAIPECTVEYVQAEMERTGATAEEVINDYIAIVDQLLKDGEIPE